MVMLAFFHCLADQYNIALKLSKECERHLFLCKKMPTVGPTVDIMLGVKTLGVTLTIVGHFYSPQFQE